MDLSGFPNTEAEFRARFADDNRCREYLARLKWPEGFRCAHCAGDRAYFLPSSGWSTSAPAVAGRFRSSPGRSSNRARSRWCCGSGPSSKSRRRSRVSRPPNCNASSGSAAIKRHGPGSPRSAPPWFGPIGSPCPARSRSPRATSAVRNPAGSGRRG